MKTVPASVNQRGSTLVEFAFVVIVLLLLIFGVVDFGRALYAYHFVAHAAREGTRYAIVRGATWSTGCAETVYTGGCETNNPNMNSYIQNLATGIGLDTTALSGALSFSAPPAPDASTCAPSPSGANDGPGCLVQVQVQYAFKFIFPLMPTSTCVVNGVTGSICMTSTSQMVISQ